MTSSRFQTPKRRKYLDESVGAVDTPLDAADLQAISQAMPPGVAAGPRYVETQMIRLNL